MSSGGEWLVEEFHNHHHRQGFSCGVEALESYFYKQANQDRQRSVAIPYVLVYPSTLAVIGFYTLSSASILCGDMPADAIKSMRLPPYKAFPAILIGRLAIDKNFQRQGFGGILLYDALRRCLSLSQQLGVLAVVVDAKDDQANRFYQAFGFQALQDRPLNLFLPVKRVAQLDLSRGS